MSDSQNDSISQQLAERRRRFAQSNQQQPEADSQPMDVDDIDEAPFAQNRHVLEQDIVSLSSREQELQNELATARGELAARRAQLSLLRQASENPPPPYSSTEAQPQQASSVGTPPPPYQQPQLTQEEKDHEIALLLQRQLERELAEEERQAQAQAQAQPRSEAPNRSPHQGFSFSFTRSTGDGPGQTFSYSSHGSNPDLAEFFGGGLDPFGDSFGFEAPGGRRDLPDMHDPFFGLMGGIPGRAPFGRLGFSPFMFRSAASPFGINRMNLDLDNMDHDQILRLQEMIGHVPRGASAQQISELPTTKFQDVPESKENPIEENDERKKCSICLEQFEEGDEIRTLPCFHIFHTDEIDQWLAQNSKCPICRQPIQGGGAPN